MSDLTKLTTPIQWLTYLKTTKFSVAKAFDKEHIKKTIEILEQLCGLSSKIEKGAK